MSQTVYTMPEAKFRSIKKRASGSRDLRKSEFAHEMKVLQLQPQPVKAKVADTLPAKAEAKKKTRLNLVSFWPVAVGLFLAGFAPEWQAMATQAGPWILRFAFPFSLLAMRHDLGLDAQMSVMLPQFALFAQLPLDGVLAMLTLARGKSLKAVAVQLFLVHAVCAFVLWLLSMNAN